jgi:tRNA wybutosine-synthesizing protein 1
MTMVKEHNMDFLDDYARLVAKSNPTYIEAKAYMHIGFSNLRLGFDHMPMHVEVKKFANQLAERTGYKVINEAPENRVVLLSRLDKPVQVGSKSDPSSKRL